ncbi:global transcription factor C [Hibiscus trionum]|uniref:FACT complex subunit n=1 Tax=Hibiscus trionum TaxID=183268 RepID=A0A9W7LHU8_HIBTR|nr:global transcription factor C [Hibiscus trionum]
MSDYRVGNSQHPNGAAPGSGNTCTINLGNFSKLATPPLSEDLRYLKSSALDIWLLGYEFPETIIIFTKKQIYFLCNQKKASFLEVVKKSAKEAVRADVVIHVKAKSDDGVALMDAILKSIRLTDVTNGLSDLFAVKDKEEVMNVKKAAYLSFNVMNNIVTPKLESVIDEEKKITHAALMDETEKAIVNPQLAKWGELDLRPSAASNDENLYYDPASVILCAVGARYNSYCSNIARTFLIGATPLQSKAYELLLKSHEAAISALKLGRKFSAVYQAAFSIVEKEAPDCIPNLTKSAGAGIGLEFLIVGEQNTEVVTGKCSKVVKDVAYSFNEDEEEEEKSVRAETNGSEPFMSKTVLRSDNHEISKELRRQHQAELARQKNEETARQLAGGPGNGDNRSGAKASTDFISYKNVNDLPPPGYLMIQVDQKNEAVLLPIYGSMLPFHVSTIKTVSNQQDTDRNCFIRIDPRHISEVVQQIKTLCRHVVARESEKAERAALVTQEKLQHAGNRFKPIRLTDLCIHPVFCGRGRKIPGTLEAHVNGFRYSTTRADERVDIMFGNIKHAFFQPAEKEMITLLHFHLHNHIMVGNKKTKDVQFYVEVMDVFQTLGEEKRSAYDPDEIEEEQRERDRKNKINMDFQSFVNHVNDLWGQPQFNGLDLEFDQPLRELGFHGVPYKASAFIVPTSSCLVELVENHFLVVTLSEIEIVNLERVGLGQKNFDMTIVFKDFKKELRIDSIPSTALDGIKEWLDITDIKYYESRLNLNWRQILKTITEDPQSFIKSGGWEFLNLEASDSDSEGEEESDQSYEPSDVEPESESQRMMTLIMTPPSSSIPKRSKPR